MHDIFFRVHNPSDTTHLPPPLIVIIMSRGGVGRYNDAITHYDRALALFPLHFKARFNRAFAMDKLDRVDVAIEEYTLALRLLDLEQLHHDDDDNDNDHENSSNNVVPSSTARLLNHRDHHNNNIHRAFVHYNRGICLDRLGRLPAAIDDFTKAIDSHPHAQYVISPTTITDANEPATHANTTHANALADFYHNRGFALLKLTHYHRAITGIEHTTSLFPYLTRSFHPLLMFAFTTSTHTDFQIALGLRPMHPPTMRYLQLCKDHLQQLVD